MTFRDLELIALLSASVVHGSQAVLIGRYLKTTPGTERAEARWGLGAVSHLFAWQFSNFCCVLLATLGLGYPSLPSKLCNLVRWGTTYALPVGLSYVATHLRLYGRPSQPALVKAVRVLRYVLLWPWLLLALVSLIAEGTTLFPPVVPFAFTGWITLALMLVFFVIFTVQGLQQRRDMGKSRLGRTRRAGLIASGIAAILLVLALVGALGIFAQLGPYISLASMMTTIPFSIYLAHRYCQFPFMDVYIREAVTGLTLVAAFVPYATASSLLPPGLQILWFVVGALTLAFGKEPLARQLERWLLGYQETLEEQEERLGNALCGLTELDSFATRSEDILRSELEAEWVTIGPEPAPDSVCRFELKGSISGWLTLGPRLGKRAYMSRQLRLARSAALQLAAQQERLQSQDKERRRMVERHELRELTARAEMRALQAQINPHFLFNTLNVLANLIQDSPERAERLIEQLAEVFRYALESTRREWVSLEEEVRFLQAYLDIESARFGDRLRHHWSLEPSASKIQIAPMLLQPLVENAVRHGIAPALQGGELWIRVKLDANQLVLEVEDSGVGISAGSSKPGFGVGLNNVKERLRRCYGRGAELVLEARRPEGTCATLFLPAGAATAASPSPRLEVSR
jgi:signal transduction histidine kinase